jgi:hypothetical protein
MRFNTIGFLRKVRLCLYLIFGLGLFGCSILKQENKAVTSLKTYRISGDLLPGYDESGLYTALDGSTIINIDHLPVAAGFTILSEQFVLSVKVDDEADLQRVLSRLQSSGFRIGNAALKN